MTDVEGRNYIGGVWKAAADGRTFEDRNPADNDDLLGTFPRSGPADVDAAVAAAEAARREWARVPVPRRADILLRAGLELEERKKELSRLMTREMGKTLRETRADVQEGIDFAFYMAGEGRRFFGQTMPSELPSKFSLTTRAPIGVCGSSPPRCSPATPWCSSRPRTRRCWPSSWWRRWSGTASRPACSTWCTASVKRRVPRSSVILESER